MRVLVTRPAIQAANWVRQLAEHGIDAVAMPLIDIAGPADPATVVGAWQGLGSRRLVMFVSPNAVEKFFALAPPGSHWPPFTRAGSIGPGTTSALSRMGVPFGCIIEPAACNAQFDSESLWQQLGDTDWNDASVLIVRGDGGRDWLAQRLTERGAQVDTVSAYRRRPPVFEGERLQWLDEAAARPAEHLWFFSSSESIDHLAEARPGLPWGRLRALATHPRIASRAKAQGIGEVHATRPTLDAVVACIQSLPS